MSMIKSEDVIQSVQDALQYISFYHPTDFIQEMTAAYEREESPAAKAALTQILINSRLAAEGKRPMCQDTGIVCAFVELGQKVTFQDDMLIEDMINEGVRRAYADQDNPLRASVLKDPAGQRKNTGDNTPAVVHLKQVPGDALYIELSAKGGGSEFKSKFTILNPSDNIADWIVSQIPLMGAGWCPPGILGIGIGGTAEKAMLMAKQACNDPIDIQDFLKTPPKTAIDQLRLELYERINALGIGAQGLGGLTTVLDIKIRDYPTHAACLPVAVVPNCVSTRHIDFTLKGEGAATFTPPNLDLWPKLDMGAVNQAPQLNLDTLTQADCKGLKAGDTLRLSGKLYTGRDAAHKRIQQYLSEGKPLPVDLKDRFIYYVGPVDPVRDEVVGPAGPTTATRMDKFTDIMLNEVGVMGMIGKAERGPETVEKIKQAGVVYLMAVGGAAVLIAQSIKKARVVAFEDLGMEAIYEFEVEDMPVIVAVDANGQSVHESGPKGWEGKFKNIPITVHRLS